MSLAVLLNPQDPLFVFEEMMQLRQLMAVMEEIAHFSSIPYLLDPASTIAEVAGYWNQTHQFAHDNFNIDLPSNYSDGYTLTHVVPPPIPNPHPPPATIQPPPYDQANLLDGGTFGIPQAQILIEGPNNTPESLPWWTFVNHTQHFHANNAILPLPTGSSTTAGTGQGEETASNPWWWASRAPVIYPFW